MKPRSKNRKCAKYFGRVERGIFKWIIINPGLPLDAYTSQMSYLLAVLYKC